MNKTITFDGDNATVAIDNGDGTGTSWNMQGDQLAKHAQFAADVKALPAPEAAKAAALGKKKP